ncbi:hypothetical protein ACEUD4_13955 [Aeromonas media]|uniref:hypothetical protein n=1 Tax=Aeromonas media TaxID=651 RepID=UPI0038D0955C
MRIALLIPLLALGLGACSSSDTGQGARGPVPSPWWYQDYYYYWDDYYPWCCDNQGEFDELIKKWWSGLDPERQQEIRDKYQEWQGNQGQPDTARLKASLATHWHAMTPEQQQALRDSRQHHSSLSQPGKAPRSALDDKASTLPGGGLLNPAGLPRADAQGLRTRPLTSPVTRPALPQRMTPPMRSFPAIRRR